MLITIPNVFSPEEAGRIHQQLLDADWVDGNVTAGYQSAAVKRNRQLAEENPVAKEIGGRILDALSRSPLFLSAALPLRVFPPLFNSYEGGEAFGTHVDNAIRHVKGTPVKIRTDLSCTLFFSDPEDYDGGELKVEDTYGVHSVKLPPGDMVLYPSTSLHHVTPVTRGRRVCSFFWLQSMIREDSRRSLMFDMDRAIQRLNGDHPGHPSSVQLTGVYHNLMRQWAEM